MTRAHVAQVCIAVLSRNASVVEAGELFVKGATRSEGVSVEGFSLKTALG